MSDQAKFYWKIVVALLIINMYILMLKASTAQPDQCAGLKGKSYKLCVQQEKTRPK